MNKHDMLVHVNNDLAAKVENASPEELVLLMYDGCLNYIRQGSKALEQKNYELANMNIQKAENIIQEFRCTLNHKYEISESLESIYYFVYKNLVVANIKSDLQLLSKIEEIVLILRDTWIKVLKRTSIINE